MIRYMCKFDKDNSLEISNVISISKYSNAQKKIVRSKKEDDNQVVRNCTCGKRTKCVVYMSNGDIVLSSTDYNTLVTKVNETLLYLDLFKEDINNNKK